MKPQKTPQRTQRWSISRVAVIIGISLVLMASSYLAYTAIDMQAQQSSLR
ncbi:hypothetical protein H7100_02895 [Candidatus Saccharibacteria bacterium]|nr:hypothetical protein [Candidatus Saccharibacteria bacterium]